MEIKNAKITRVSLTMADHGVLTFQVFIDGGGWVCSIGNYVNGRGYLGANHWEAHGSGLVAMMKIMDIVGVERWEDLTGKYIRIEDNGWGSTITKIGNNAFKNCSKLRDLVLPGSIKEIGSNAFDGCDNLETIFCNTKAVKKLLIDLPKHIEIVCLEF